MATTTKNRPSKTNTNGTTSSNGTPRANGKTRATSPNGAPPAQPVERTFVQIPLSDLHPDPKNKREDYGDIAALAASITKHGLLTPLRVKPDPDGGYLIVFGERRYLALTAANIPTATCEVIDGADTLARDVDRIAENLHRKALTPVEEARELASLAQDHGIRKQEDIAALVGLSQPSVQRRLSILRLPDDVLAALIKEQITFEEGFELARIKDQTRLLKAFNAGRGYIVNAARNAVADEEAERRVAKTIAALKKQNLTLVPYPPYGTWSGRPEKPLGSLPGQVNVAVDDHASEPCHAATVSSVAQVVYVCTDPTRHQPATASTAAADGASSAATVNGKAKAVPAEETPEQKAQREKAEAEQAQREAEQTRREQQREELRAAKQRRADFVCTLLTTGKPPQALVTEHVAQQIVGYANEYDLSTDARSLLGLPEPDEDDAEPLVTYAQVSKQNLWRAALAVCFALVEKWVPSGTYYPVRALDAQEQRHFDLLTALGYEPSPAERALIDGPAEQPDPDGTTAANAGSDDARTWTGDEQPEPDADPGSEPEPTEDKPGAEPDAEPTEPVSLAKRRNRKSGTRQQPKPQNPKRTSKPTRASRSRRVA
ncbi:MAG TPA: ParB/RepB/Spo0J family partition protein [Mycobacteriales bacterium]|jgi:ParB/RepB/Spo0J family partition protein|nr:ParB/RepB/Spo0J family partition protein [Mycobacteriales bacterium]